MDFDTQFKNGHYRLDGPRLPIVSSVCSYCTHYQRDRKCGAFPDGIPLEIWLGHNPHTSPFPGDLGIQFEPVRNQVSQSPSGVVMPRHDRNNNGNQP